MTTFNTNNPVPSTDGRDLSDNAETIDQIVNDPGPTAPTRLGKSLSTIKNLEAQYVFTAINSGVWASGQIFTAVNQFMVFTGTAYKPKNSTTLPYVVGVTPVGDANVEVVGNLSTAQGDQRYDKKLTLLQATADVNAVVGMTIRVTDRKDGLFDWVSGETPNGFNIIAHDSLSIQLKLRDSVNQSIRAWGAAADGVVNDTAVLQAFDAAGGYLIEGGIVRVQANISLVSDYEFKNGGIIAPDSSFTITWSGAITAADVRILDGNFKVSKVNRLPEVKVAWFGAKSSDLLTDMTNQALADANAKAIRQARNMVAIGVPLGIYVTPILKLINGLCVVDDDNNSGTILDVDSYMTVFGYGDASVLRPMDGAKAFDVISMTVDAANSMLLDKFQIYGEASAQTNVQNGIVVNPTVTAQIYNKIGNFVYVKEMSGHAGKMIGKGWENSKWNPRLMRDSTLHNLLVTACSIVEFSGCTYRTAKSGQSGAVFDGPGVIAARIHDNNFDENNAQGLIVSNTGGRHKIYNNEMKSNFTGNGMSLDRIDNSEVYNNKLEANGARGALVDDSTNVHYHDNHSRANQNDGHVFGINNSDILSNTSHTDGQATDDTYTGIFITGSSADDNNVQCNKVRHGGGATQLRYGLQISPGTASANFVSNNDLKNAGRTANLFDDGGGTVTTPGNRIV